MIYHRYISKNTTLARRYFLGDFRHFGYKVAQDTIFGEKMPVCGCLVSRPANTTKKRPPPMVVGVSPKNSCE